VGLPTCRTNGVLFDGKFQGEGQASSPGPAVAYVNKGRHDIRARTRVTGKPPHPGQGDPGSAETTRTAVQHLADAACAGPRQNVLFQPDSGKDGIPVHDSGTPSRSLGTPVRHLDRALTGQAVQDRLRVQPPYEHDPSTNRSCRSR